MVFFFLHWQKYDLKITEKCSMLSLMYVYSFCPLLSPSPFLSGRGAKIFFLKKIMGLNNCWNSKGRVGGLRAPPPPFLADPPATFGRAKTRMLTTLAFQIGA